MRLRTITIIFGWVCFLGSCKQKENSPDAQTVVQQPVVEGVGSTVGEQKAEVAGGLDSLSPAFLAEGLKACEKKYQIDATVALNLADDVNLAPKKFLDILTHSNQLAFMDLGSAFEKKDAAEIEKNFIQLEHIHFIYLYGTDPAANHFAETFQEQANEQQALALSESIPPAYIDTERDDCDKLSTGAVKKTTARLSFDSAKIKTQEEIAAAEKTTEGGLNLALEDIKNKVMADAGFGIGGAALLASAYLAYKYVKLDPVAEAEKAIKVEFDAYENLKTGQFLNTEGEEFVRANGIEFNKAKLEKKVELETKKSKLGVGALTTLLVGLGAAIASTYLEGGLNLSDRRDARSKLTREALQDLEDATLLIKQGH